MRFALLTLAAVGGAALASIGVACSSSPSTTTNPPPVNCDGGADAQGAGSGPSLASLSVVFSGQVANELVPTFSPSIHDYYVRCNAGVNDVEVSMSGAGNATAKLTQPTTSSAGKEQKVSAKVNEGAAIVATADEGSQSTEYWVRCIPHDFPPIAWQPHACPDKISPGYYLVGGWWPPPGLTGYAMVLDGNGVPVWFSLGPAFGVSDVVALQPNTISFFPFNIGAVLPYETLDLVHMTKTTLQPNDALASQHELIRLDNGDYLVIAPTLVRHVDLTGLSLAERDGGMEPLGTDNNIEDCTVIEFKPDGTPVHEWHAYDHFDPRTASTWAADGLAAETGQSVSGPVIDVFHCNSIDIDPGSGNFLVSSRHMNSVFFIDWKGTQKVLWKMGGNPSSRDPETVFIPVDSPFVAQHDGRLLKGWSDCNGGAGQVSVYDDETFTSGVPARAVIYDVQVGSGKGGACPQGTPGTPGKATLAWQYASIQNTGLGGSVRIDANGNRLIGWGSYGAPGWVLSEVDPQGNDLLDVEFTNQDTSYRSIKVPLSTFDIDVLRRTAGFR